MFYWFWVYSTYLYAICPLHFVLQAQIALILVILCLICCLPAVWMSHSLHRLLSSYSLPNIILVFKANMYVSVVTTLCLLYWAVSKTATVSNAFLQEAFMYICIPYLLHKQMIAELQPIITVFNHRFPLTLSLQELSVSRYFLWIGNIR